MGQLLTAISYAFREASVPRCTAVHRSTRGKLISDRGLASSHLRFRQFAHVVPSRRRAQVIQAKDEFYASAI